MDQIFHSAVLKLLTSRSSNFNTKLLSQELAVMPFCKQIQLKEEGKALLFP